MLILERPWTSQPQTVARPAQRWLDRGLVYAANLGVNARNLAWTDATVVTGTKVGVVASGRVRGFGTGVGMASTDRVDTGLLWKQNRSYVFRVKYIAPGGSNFGRIFGLTAQPTTTDGVQLIYDTAAAKFTFGARFNALNSEQSFTTSISEPVIALAYSHVAGFAARIFVNGAPAAMGSVSTGSGIAVYPVTSLFIGNLHAAVSPWGGYIGESLIFDSLLTDAELSLLSGNISAAWEDRRIPIPTSTAAATVPTLSASTYVPGSLTSTGWRPQITAS